MLRCTAPPPPPPPSPPIALLSLFLACLLPRDVLEYCMCTHMHVYTHVNAKSHIHHTIACMHAPLFRHHVFDLRTHARSQVYTCTHMRFWHAHLTLSPDHSHLHTQKLGHGQVRRQRTQTPTLSQVSLCPHLLPTRERPTRHRECVFI